tara:strand:- start:2147 stop:2521 length:375 start_codon:yes stop_codon:yes gene_type:complete
MENTEEKLKKKEYQKQYQKQYHLKYYQRKTKLRKPYVITKPPPPPPEWPKPDPDGQLLHTEKYIFYINKIWSNHRLYYLKKTQWEAYNIYDVIDKKTLRLKIRNIISYIDKYNEYAVTNPQNTQ